MSPYVFLVLTLVQWKVCFNGICNEPVRVDRSRSLSLVARIVAVKRVTLSVNLAGLLRSWTLKKGSLKNVLYVILRSLLRQVSVLVRAMNLLSWKAMVDL